MATRVLINILCSFAFLNAIFNGTWAKDKVSKVIYFVFALIFLAIIIFVWRLR